MIAVSLLKSVPDIAKIYAFFCVEVSSGTAALVLCFHIPWNILPGPWLSFCVILNGCYSRVATSFLFH